MNQNLKKYSIFLSLNLQASYDKIPEIEVLLDNITCSPVAVNNNIVDFKIVTTIGEHSLSIKLLNKKPTDTVLDSNGAIIQDLNVQLLTLKIDELNITDYAKNKNTYITDEGNIEKTYGFMHRNGVMRFSFSCPAFYFLRNLALINTTQ
jgi:hypothetical protein